MSKVSLQWESADRTTISRERDKGAYRDESPAVTGHLIAIDRIEYTSRKRAARKLTVEKDSLAVLKAVVPLAGQGVLDCHVYIWSKDTWKPIAHMSGRRLGYVSESSSEKDVELALDALFQLGFSVVAD